jgi:hypothetical protein
MSVARTWIQTVSLATELVLYLACSADEPSQTTGTEECGSDMQQCSGPDRCGQLVTWSDDCSSPGIDGDAACVLTALQERERSHLSIVSVVECLNPDSGPYDGYYATFDLYIFEDGSAIRVRSLGVVGGDHQYDPPTVGTLQPSEYFAACPSDDRDAFLACLDDIFAADACMQQTCCSSDATPHPTVQCVESGE